MCHPYIFPHVICTFFHVSSIYYHVLVCTVHVIATSTPKNAKNAFHVLAHGAATCQLLVFPCHHSNIIMMSYWHHLPHHCWHHLPCHCWHHADVIFHATVDVMQKSSTMSLLTSWVILLMSSVDFDLLTMTFWLWPFICLTLNSYRDNFFPQSPFLENNIWLELAWWSLHNGIGFVQFRELWNFGLPGSILDQSSPLRPHGPPKGY